MLTFKLFNYIRHVNFRATNNNTFININSVYSIYPIFMFIKNFQITTKYFEIFVNRRTG